MTADEIAAAVVSPAVDAALDDAIAHCRAFNEQVLARAADWSFEPEPGLRVGEKISPIASAGLFVPSGKASYPSVVYQLGAPAVVAGVPQIVLVVPPIPGGDGAVDPAVLVVCRKLGITDVFRVNGPAGIAALGFGTESIPKVRKIVGPGSPAVTLAQVELQRHGVATMMLLGPTESLVVADDSADPQRLAADLLIEAEHGTDSSVVLVTTSAERRRRHRRRARPPAGRRCRRSGPRRPAPRSASTAAACSSPTSTSPSRSPTATPPSTSRSPSPTTSSTRVVDGLHNAGEILVGQHTPFSAANFVIGCPASLPTSGFAEVSSGITVEAFLKRTAVARADSRALARMAPSVVALADHEGFPAHAAAIRLRQS